MNKNTGITDVLTGEELAREYAERFIAVTLDELNKMNVPDDIQKRLWHCAVNASRPTVVGHAPGVLFRNIVERIAAGEKPEDILADYEKN